MDKIKELFLKYKALIMYAIFGVATTIVNVFVYFVFTRVLNFENTISNIFAWILAVTFAYLTNRKWVFESQNNKIGDIIKEILYFYACRFFTGLLDVVIMYITVDILDINGMLKGLMNLLMGILIVL